MTIKVTRWRPDTCGCIIEYSWDTEVPQDRRVHTPHAIIKDCPEHTGKTKEELYTVLNDENTRKNRFYGELIKNTRIAEEITQEDGSTVRRLKRGIEFDYSFDANRNLEVRVIGATLTPTERTALQTKADLDFGVNKVRVV